MTRATTAIRVRSRGDLAKYAPGQGLKTIAATEAAEKHFARAKDASNLVLAIRAKLEAQAEFVFWWDNKGPGATLGRPKKISDPKSFPEGLPSPVVVHRWRQKLNDPEKFEATYEAAAERYRKILEFDTTALPGQNTGEYEWYTPAEYIEAARLTLGAIDLDPASTDAANTVVQAAQIFTVEDEALTESWDGRVWMNPPYAQPLIAHFCDKLAESVEAGTVTAAVALVNNATETEWFQRLARASSAFCCPNGRVKFWNPRNEKAAPLQGQVLFYFGVELGAFESAFEPFGFTARVNR